MVDAGKNNNNKQSELVFPDISLIWDDEQHQKKERETSSLLPTPTTMSCSNHDERVGPFVKKLMEMLTDPGNSSICGFLREGLEFQIRDKRMFESLLKKVRHALCVYVF
jgi:hypothetical protein